MKKLKRSECAVLSLVLERQWFILIENGTKKIEWIGKGLPGWLKLAANGKLSGKPTKKGLYILNGKKYVSR